MREILFRGKRVDNGEWVEGCYAEFVHGLDGYTKPGIQVIRCVPSVANRLMPTYETELVEVIPETVGQYTGIADTNGNKIFEGDVAVCQGGEYYHGTWEYESTEIVKDIRSMGFLEYCEKAIVIGNIHDKEE